MFIVYILFDELIWNGTMVIMMLSDTLSNLDKLDQAEYSKYKLCSSKFYMAHVYVLL